ncbi:hypothetical protein GLV94_11085 [Virgibacillus halodenitrificans]|uniref:Uncharacterized protein n=1 Tax=Virgibacillus halodenitrificans TaxID=1482 RepID=A0ABR7VIN0_VIRHA|nr:hypothetical protein [Virgibacillus halodenitrificans]MBD1221785.1 hypothetical protein [Virgibacillus halodenitrificans]MCG1030149.1 hypothetical protein [Virgibacillus halodenitrificans]MCJ0932324.1 hypothetical protein [Virgibacillus halodenitrificans]MEC2158636.1 hypothetical protein [Virgibacillus halodenitrificans]MYL46197.1 hypothetical protein [Virgibacillus halodenitrificans]
MKMNNDYNHIYDLCKKHMHSYVLAETTDGSQVDGIITGLDDEYVYFAVPIGAEEHQNMASPDDQRQFGYGFGYPGYGFPGYGYPGYGYGGYPGFYRPRRFRRLVLPLAALTALSILPWY